MNTQIRRLQEADAAAYQVIRRRTVCEIVARVEDILWMNRTLQQREG
jgi:hypothetical protein